PAGATDRRGVLGHRTSRLAARGLRACRHGLGPPALCRAARCARRPCDLIVSGTSQPMADPINIRTLAPGTRVVLENGAVAEIVSNPNDGVWLFARYLSAPHDPNLVGEEEMIFAQDVAATGEPE